MSNKQDLKIYLNYKVIDYSLAKTGHRSILSHGCWQLKSLFLRLSEETSGSSRDKLHTILSPASGVSGQDWHDMTILTQSPSHLASPWSEPGPRSQIGAGVSPVRAVHQPRLSCVPVILLAYCWTIMGFAAALRIYKFWLNYWFTIYPNNFTIFVNMYAPISSNKATKTSEWKQVIEVYFRHDLWLNVFSWHFWSLFRAKLLFPWMFSIVMTRITELHS